MTGPTEPTGLIGRTIGSYTIVARLGQGGMASVYHARQEAIDRSVAIKVMPAELLHDPNFLKRFINEARTLAKLQHPNILPLYDFGETEGLPYIVMPLMSGGTLVERIKRAPFTPIQAVHILAPIAQALDYAHAQGLLHRDIKPNNILFDARDTPILADFGIAKSLENPTGMTGTGIIGTPDYMSPEQARGESIDHRSDIYALGIVIYYMLAGQTPFRATTPMAVLFKHVTEQPPPLRDFRPNLSPAVEAIVLKSLAKNPADRHQSATELINALAAAASEPVQPTPPPSRTVTPPPRPQPQPTPTFSQTSPVMSSVTGPMKPIPAAPASKKGGIGIWVAVAIGVIGLGVCGLGGAGLMALSAASAQSASATRAAVTAIALSGEQTQQAQSTEQAGIDATATAVLLAEPINRGSQWPVNYTDDFSADYSNWATGELTGTRVGGGRYVSNGIYQWNINAIQDVNLNTYSEASSNLGDFYYSVDAWRTVGPATADYGSTFRVVSDRSFYYFAINDRGFYSFYKLVSNTWTILIDYTASDAIIPGGTNRIGVVGEGAHFTFYVNGIRVAEYDDDTFDSGHVGMAIQLNPNENAVFAFDNVEVHAP